MNDEELAVALNKHGVFFKKSVLHRLKQLPNIGVLGEELGYRFGKTRVADFILFQKLRNITISVVFECKRTDPRKVWIFLPHIDKKFRRFRQVGKFGTYSDRTLSTEENGIACSEGYECWLKDGNKEKDPKTPLADQTPIFDAASQVASAYLGYLQTRSDAVASRPAGMPDLLERCVPILITTAQLRLIQHPWHEIPIESGLITTMNSKPVDHVLLQQPFPTPEGQDCDFRNSDNEHWPTLHTESVYIVAASKICEFLSLARFEDWADG